MNKQEALLRLTKAEQEIAQCRAIINAPDKVENPVFYPKDKEEFYYINHIGAAQPMSLLSRQSTFNKFPSFKTMKASDAFAEAFQVMLELRACEGVVPFDKNLKAAYVIAIDNNFTPYVTVAASSDTGCLTPFYRDYLSAYNSVLKVGKDRISAAAKTLNGL